MFLQIADWFLIYMHTDEVEKKCSQQQLMRKQTNPIQPWSQGHRQLETEGCLELNFILGPNSRKRVNMCIA